MQSPVVSDLKEKVRRHWEEEVCGTRYGVSGSREQYFEEIERKRYSLEPYIRDFAAFPGAKGKTVLEIGVGAGTDFSNWVKWAEKAVGVDLTEAAVNLTRERLELEGADSARYELRIADAEDLPFADGSFDLVYSWGVLHHSPDTEAAFAQVYRVLKPGATVKAMIYHVPSWTGLMLWTWHCLLKGHPFRSMRNAIFHHLESPGTKAYTLSETRRFLERIGFHDIRLSIKLGPGDLLEITPSRKYRSRIVRTLWKFYPRWLVRSVGLGLGLYLLIEGQRPARFEIGRSAGESI